METLTPDTEPANDKETGMALSREEIYDKVKGVLEERSEEHTSELQSRLHLVCRLLLEKKKTRWVSTPSLVYFASVPPTPIDSSSGCAWIASSLSGAAVLPRSSAICLCDLVVPDIHCQR